MQPGWQARHVKRWERHSHTHSVYAMAPGAVVAAHSFNSFPSMRPAPARFAPAPRPVANRRYTPRSELARAGNKHYPPEKTLTFRKNGYLLEWTWRMQAEDKVQLSRPTRSKMRSAKHFTCLVALVLRQI